MAKGDTGVRLAMPLTTIVVDGMERERILRLVEDERAEVVVVGYPRNQSGEPTAQTAYVEQVAAGLKDAVPTLVFQDESLTSVIAEQRLQQRGKPYDKGAIDAEAAAIILQDYLELVS